jgi:hypothetical protein
MAKLYKIVLWAGGWLAVALLVSGMPVLDTGIHVFGFPLWSFVLVQVIAFSTGFVLSGDERTGSPSHVVAYVIAFIAVNFLAIVAVDMLSMFTPIRVLAGH